MIRIQNDVDRGECVIRESANTADLNRDTGEPTHDVDCQNGPLNERNEPMSEARSKKFRTLGGWTEMRWGSDIVHVER